LVTINIIAPLSFVNAESSFDRKMAMAYMPCYVKERATLSFMLL